MIWAYVPPQVQEPGGAINLNKQVVSMAGKLTDRQRRFVSEYLIDLNATQAAIRAGYSQKTAYSAGQRMLKKVEIQTTLQEEIQKRSIRTNITQDMVLKEYARIAFFDPRKLFDDEGNPKDVSALDDDTAAALAGLDVVKEIDPESGVTSFTKKYKITNKLGALDSLAKHLGMFDGAGKGYGDEKEKDALSQSLEEMAKELESD